MAKSNVVEMHAGIDLGEVSSLARILTDYDREIEQLAAQMKQIEAKARNVREESLPSAMAALGLESVKLATGEVIKTKLEVYCGIPVARKAEAFEWLEENNYGSLIKTEVSVAFGRDQREEAANIAVLLSEKGLSVESSMAVAPQTLKAWLKEQLGAGRNVPLDLFGARPVTVATITKK